MGGVFGAVLFLSIIGFFIIGGAIPYRRKCLVDK